MNISSQKGTEENPYQSAQIVVVDDKGKIYLHKNTSIEKGVKKLTLLGGKREENESYISAARRELGEEAHLITEDIHLKEIYKDTPKEFEKGWFEACIYSLLISKRTGEILGKQEDIQIFPSYQSFIGIGSNYQFGTSFEHVRFLIERALNHIELGK